MALHLLPIRTAGAAENMAVDFLLLQRYPHPAAPRFRHYAWRGPAVTFGFSQKIAFVRAHLPAPDSGLDLCRRPTGGGLVDHRHDWTYTLVIPRGHPLYDEPAPRSYRAVHECLATILRTLGQPAAVKTACVPMAPCGSAHDTPPPSQASSLPPSGPTVCFQRAELYDVINAATGAKIAGAAQKRNKHGLLFQGSIEKSALGEINWDDFGERFPAALGAAINIEPQSAPWPEFNEDEVTGLIEQYASPEWIEYR